MEINQFIADVAVYIDGAVAGFFMVSGYFIRLFDQGGISHVGAFARRASVRLIVPFLLFSLLYGALLLAIGKTTPTDIIYGLALLQGTGPQMYFLPYLFLVQTCSYLVFNAVPPRYRTALIVITLAVGLGLSLIAPVAISTGPSPYLLPFYLAAFLFGLLLSMFERKWPGIWPSVLALAVALSVLASVDAAGRLFDFALAAALFCAALALAHGPWLARRLPGSGGIYLLHTPILNYAISTVLLALGLGGFANLFGALALTYVSALAATLLTLRLWPRSRLFLLE